MDPGTAPAGLVRRSVGAGGAAAAAGASLMRRVAAGGSTAGLVLAMVPVSMVGPVFIVIVVLGLVALRGERPD